MHNQHWWQQDNGNVTPRFMAEVEIMQATYGNTFRLMKRELKQGDIVWRGTVTIQLAEIPPDLRQYTIRVVCRHRHPDMAPDAYIERNMNSIKAGAGHTLPGSKHNETRPCLYNPDDGRNYGWNPARSTAATTVTWTIDWLYGWWVWYITGKWPGMEHSVDKTDDDESQPPRLHIPHTFRRAR